MEEKRKVEGGTEIRAKGREGDSENKTEWK